MENTNKPEKTGLLEKAAKLSINYTGRILLTLGAISFVSIVAIFCLYLGTAGRGSEAMKAAYNKAKEKARSETYDSFYHSSFEHAEEKYHVKNQVDISVESIQEKNVLEVLTVRDVQYVIRSKDENKAGVTSWLEVPGTGVYTVDLSVGEFLVDSENASVKIRVPQPQLTECAVDYSGVKQLVFENDILNESIKVGEDMAQNDIAEGFSMLKENMQSNKQFTDSARKTASDILKNLVADLNQDVPEIRVEVEFF